ncbi:unnamed protein product [Pylaiella littoralis]
MSSSGWSWSTFEIVRYDTSKYVNVFESVVHLLSVWVLSWCVFFTMSSTCAVFLSSILYGTLLSHADCLPRVLLLLLLQRSGLCDCRDAPTLPVPPCSYGEDSS